MNTNWTEHHYFAALDWASDHHDVIVLDRLGAVQAEFRFAHSAEGWAQFTSQMQLFTGAPITLETSSGPAVDQLLQRAWRIYPVAPTAAARYRERKVPSGTKDRPTRDLGTGRCSAHRRPCLASAPSAGRGHRHLARLVP